jgi:hypothetical protein
MLNGPEAKAKQRTNQRASVREARCLANEVTLEQLTPMIKHDSGADIADFFKGQVTTCPVVMNELAVSLIPSNSNATLINSNVPFCVSTGLLDIPVDDIDKVTYPLGYSVLTLADAT